MAEKINNQQLCWRKGLRRNYFSSLLALWPFHFSHGFFLNRSSVFNVFKYHVLSTDQKISVRIKIGIIFIFRLHRCSIQLVVFVPVGLSPFLRDLLQVLLGVEISSVARLADKSHIGRNTTNWMGRPWTLKIKLIPTIILREM